MDTLRRSTLRILPFVLTIALVAGACSSSAPGADDDAGDPPPVDTAGEPLARVIAASDEALEADSMHMTFDVTIGVGGREITGSGEADVALDELRQHMTVRYDSMPGMPDGFGMEMIVDGSTMYLRTEGMPIGAFPTEWLSMDMSEAVPGFEELAAFGNGQSDPSNAFGYLQGAEDASEVGTEMVDGVETTHYEVTVNLTDAASEVPAELRPEMRRALGEFRKGFGTTTMPVEVWVDDDGLPRRMRIVMQSEGAGALGAFGMEMTVDITRYGHDFELDIPAASEVTDLTDLMTGRQGAGWS